MGQDTYTDQEIIDALVQNDGIVSQAAEALGCSRTTLYNRMDRVQNIEDMYKSINERQKKRMEEVGMAVATDRSHPQWFQTHRYYNRVKFGITENQVDITSGGQKIEFVPASTVDEESLQ